MLRRSRELEDLKEELDRTSKLLMVERTLREQAEVAKAEANHRELNGGSHYTAYKILRGALIAHGFLDREPLIDNAVAYADAVAKGINLDD